MEINASFAGRGYLDARAATMPDADGAAARFGAAATDFAETLKETETVAEDTLVGGADPHALVEALAQSQIAVEAAVTIRNKVVEAYREILRMPV